MTKIKIVVECPCGEQHVWWHDCPIPMRDPGAAYSVPEVRASGEQSWTPGCEEEQ